MTTHSDICRDARTRATWRKANDPLPDSLRDRLILDAIERCESAPDQLRELLQRAREEILRNQADE